LNSQLIEKEHAEMGERHFARPRLCASADQRGHARRMVRRAERPNSADAPAGEIPGKASDHADLEDLRH
jgi:hypothetical protein